jgi:hypothetical protein
MEHVEQTPTQTTQQLKELVVKWYLDPRFWLFLFGVLCWVASAIAETQTSETMIP